MTTAPATDSGRLPRNEGGVALISALSALLLLTPLVMALLSVSTFELLISRNLVDTTQALFAAESGIEWAFNVLVNTPDWSAAAATVIVPDDLLPRGRITITVRQAARADDLAVTSTGAVNRAQRTIQAIIRRDSTTPPGPASAASAFDRHAVVSWREP